MKLIQDNVDSILAHSFDKHQLAMQAIFDTALAGIRQQGEPSGNQLQCFYRKDERKCAAGWVLTDEEYSPDMEGRSVLFLFTAKRLPSRLMPYFKLLGKIQRAHDQSSSIQDGETGSFTLAAPHSFMNRFEKSMSEIANEFDLEYSR